MTEKSITLSLTTDEAVTINNALNEVCHGLDLEEFDSRIGVSMELAKALLRRVQAELDNV